MAERVLRGVLRLGGLAFMATLLAGPVVMAQQAPPAGGAGALFLGQKHAKQWAAVAAIAPAAFMMEGNRAQILGDMQKAGMPDVFRFFAENAKKH